MKLQRHRAPGITTNPCFLLLDCQCMWTLAFDFDGMMKLVFDFDGTTKLQRRCFQYLPNGLMGATCGR
eukprot:2030246-Rhodomonas_salina.3